MSAPELSLRFAEPADAPFLATAALAAGGGIYEHLLAEAVRGIPPETALAAAIAGGADGLSWRNGLIAERDGNPLGAAIAYPAAEYRLAPAIRAAATPAALKDLDGLFSRPPPLDSFYLHAIWTNPAYRGAGVGGLLLDAVTGLAAETGAAAAALHVWADNAPALALYQARGFTVAWSIPVPRRRALPHDGGKHLMTRAV